MQGNTLSLVFIVAGVVCVAIGIFYLIPGVYHPFTFSPPYESHKTHALAFFALAVLAFIGSRFVRSSARH